MTIKKIEEHFPSIQAISSHRNSLIGIIGPTGSGKSTLISYFLHAKLKYQKVAGKGKKFKIDHQNPDPKYPAIGH
jgi:ABC-type cobalamin/Fe3+-siderophores transport system ATPase subunit